MMRMPHTAFASGDFVSRSQVVARMGVFPNGKGESGTERASHVHGPAALQCVGLGSPETSAAMMGDRNSRVAPTISANEAGTCSCCSRFRNADHWTCWSSAKGLVNASTTGDSAVPRRLKVSLTADGQIAAVEVELSGQQPDVVEVLHPAVQHAQFDHRFEFFGDSAFAAVAEHLWSGGKSSITGRSAGSGPGYTTSPKPTSIRMWIRAVPSAPWNRILIPSYSALSAMRSVRMEVGSKIRPSGCTSTLRISRTCAAISASSLRVSDRVGRCPWLDGIQANAIPVASTRLEDEPLGVFGPGQPIEEPLHGEIMQQLVERPMAAPSPAEEALPDGRGHSAHVLHKLASR